MERLWAPWRLEYVQHADEQDGCVFCLASAADDAGSLVLCRGERAFALLNRFPYASGHLMVAPYRHGAGFDALDEAEALEVHRLAVQGIEEQVRPLELLQCLLRGRRGIQRHGIAQRSAQPIEDRRAEQELADRRRLTPKDLLDEVVEHEAVGPRERPDEPRGILVAP